MIALMALWVIFSVCGGGVRGGGGDQAGREDRKGASSSGHSCTEIFEHLFFPFSQINNLEQNG